MFFFVSKFLCYLVFPFSAAMLMLALFWLLRNRRPRLGWWLFWAGFVLLYAAGTAPVSDLLIRPLEAPFDTEATQRAPQAIVVLGGLLDSQRSRPGRIELSEAGDRLVEAVLLARKWPRALLVISGGTGNPLDQSVREAPFIKDLAIRLGVAEVRIRTDAESRNTRENAVNTRQILEQEGVTDFVLITSAFHMRRSMACFEKEGLSPTPHAVDFRNHWGQYDVRAVVPEAVYLSRSTSAIREYVGLVMYRIRGYI